jgi:hypothetical protein
MTAAHRVTSPVLSALESTWAAIVRRHPELPVVAFAIGSGTANAPAGALMTAGHFAPGRWARESTGVLVAASAAAGPAAAYDVPEVFIAGELLALGAEQVLATMLHEAAHALAAVREITDTSRQGRYHNARFRELATELGLSVAKVGTIGWSGTELTEQTRAAYRAQLVTLGKATLHRRGESRGEATGRKSNNNGAALSCPTCGRKLRASRSSADAGEIVCWPCLTDRLDPELADELAELLAGATFAAEDAAEDAEGEDD